MSPEEGEAATRVTAACTCLEGWVGEDCANNVYVTAGLYIFIIAAGISLLFALAGIVIGRAIARRSARREAASLARRRLLDHDWRGRT